MEPQFVRFDAIQSFDLAPGVNGRPLFGEGAIEDYAASARFIVWFACSHDTRCPPGQ